MPRGRNLASRFMAGIIIAAGMACAQGSPPEAQRPTVVELGQQLEWQAIDGAVEYRVQVWDGTRLLFEEVATGRTLVPTEAMRRALRGAAGAQLQVRGIAADGLQVGEVQRRELGAPGG